MAFDVFSCPLMLTSTGTVRERKAAPVRTLTLSIRWMS